MRKIGEIWLELPARNQGIIAPKIKGKLGLGIKCPEGWVRGDSHMKVMGMLVGNLELNP